MAEPLDLHEYLSGLSGERHLSLAQARQAAQRFALTLYEVEEAALALNILPTRYLRNGLSCTEQLRLFRARLSIVGCGGLGGAVAEILARIGIGHLRLVDPDSFEEHNLNRQRFATTENLGCAKVEAARGMLAAINPALRVTPVQATFSEEDILACHMVVDGLDTPQKRLALAALCTRHNRPLIHGAVREWYGQTGQHNADNDLMTGLYPARPTRDSAPPPKVLAPTVACIASMQAAEVCKLLLDIDSPLDGQWLSCNLLDCEFERIEPGAGILSERRER